MATCGRCHKTDQTVAHIRACYAAKYGNVATMERPDSVQPTDRICSCGCGKRVHAMGPTPSATSVQQTDAWAAVNGLRKQMVPHLTPKPSGQKLGFFAINVADGIGGAPVKFYRVKQVQNGRVYLDAQGSDEYWPVRSPERIKMVLKAILASPKKAAELYASSLGKCYRCGRTLTDETSRSIGMGPECRSK